MFYHSQFTTAGDATQDLVDGVLFYTHDRARAGGERRYGSLWSESRHGKGTNGKVYSGEVR
jgi:hypothetical protein